MKKYEMPLIEKISLSSSDILTDSKEGTETSPMPDGDGIWDLDI